MKKIILIIFLFTNCLYSQTLYNWRILRVIDGDTVEVEAKFLPKELGKKLSLRIYGIDTPESNFLAKTFLEKNRGLEAKNFTSEKIKNAKKIQIIIYKWDKYGGRVLGDIIIDGESLKNLLIKNNYAVNYDGKKKMDWSNFLNQQ